MAIVRPTGLAGTWNSGAVSDVNEVTANDSTYVTSGDNVTSTGSFTFDPITNLATTGTCTLRLRHAQADGGVAPSSGGGTSSISSIVVEGTTVWSTGVNANQGSFAALNVTFDASTITASGTFQVDINYSGGGGSPANRRGIAISWVEFEYPVATISYTLTATSGDVAVGSSNAALRVTRNPLIAESSDVAISGGDAVLIRARLITAESNDVAIEGGNALLSREYVLPAESGNVSIAGGNAEFVLTTGYTLIADSGDVSIAGGDASSIRGYTLAVTQGGSVSINGGEATFSRGYVLSAESV